MKISVFLAANCAAFLTMLAPCLAAPGVVVAPLHSPGPDPAYPRLVHFPDAKIMARVNALLAAQEKKDRAGEADCYAQLKEANLKPDNDTYSADTSVTYLSAHYLAINVLTSYYCGGPYPTTGAPVSYTIDLTKGTLLDWKTVFKPGFLGGASPSGLTKLYRANYAKLDDGKDCQNTIESQNPLEYSVIVLLDVKKGVVIQPELAHVVAVCADEMVRSPAELGRYLANTDLLADLKANVK